MKLKRNDDVRKIFFIFSKFSSKGSIELNATFEQSPNEIFSLLHKQRKLRTSDEIVVLMHDESL